MTINVGRKRDSILLKAAEAGYDLNEVIILAAYASLNPEMTSIPIDISGIDDIGLNRKKVRVSRSRLPLRIQQQWKGRPDCELAEWLKVNAKEMIHSSEKETNVAGPVLTKCETSSPRKKTPHISVRVDIEGGDSYENVD